MAYVYGRFSGQVEIRVTLYRLPELDVATSSHELLERYDPVAVYNAAQTDPAYKLKEELLRHRSDGYELCNWHTAAVRPEVVAGASRWEDRAEFSCVNPLPSIIVAKAA